MRKAIAIRHAGVHRKGLLLLAEEMPGAWLGIRIAALLLLLEGQPLGWIARVFGLHRSNVNRWIRRVNQEGLQGLAEKARSGRPGQLTVSIRRRLEIHLEKQPERFGWGRSQWDGPTLVQHAKRYFGVTLKTRQAQRWMHRLGYRMKRAGYVYVQARKEDADRFRTHIKKAPESEAG